MMAVSTIELGLRMVVGLAVFLGLAWGLTKVTRNRLGSLGRDADLDVKARRQLTRSASVAVLRAGNRHFLLGLSDGAISVLAEGDDLFLPAAGSVAGSVAAVDGSAAGDGVEVEDRAPDQDGQILDVRAGDLSAHADGLPKRGAWRRHGRADGPAPTGMSVIEALRERTVRRI